MQFKDDMLFKDCFINDDYERLSLHEALEKFRQSKILYMSGDENAGNLTNSGDVQNSSNPSASNELWSDSRQRLIEEYDKIFQEKAKNLHARITTYYEGLDSYDKRFKKLSDIGCYFNKESHDPAFNKLQDDRETFSYIVQENTKLREVFSDQLYNPKIRHILKVWKIN